MNVALGFDTYVIIRHGMPPTKEKVQNPQLGCYFCNDVVAPRDVWTNPFPPPSFNLHRARGSSSRLLCPSICAKQIFPTPVSPHFLDYFPALVFLAG